MKPYLIPLTVTEMHPLMRIIQALLFVLVCIVVLPIVLLSFIMCKVFNLIPK